MMLRQEAALDHSIDRKVRILLRLRKDATDRPVARAGQDQDDGVRMESTEEIVESDISAQAPQSAEAVENLKSNEQCGNVTENKGPLWKTGAEAGILWKTKVVTRKMRECY